MATVQQVQHYQAQAQQATRLRTYRADTSPELSAQWQGERRQAIATMRELQATASDRGDYAFADALLFAMADVQHALRERAAWVIEEGVRMTFVHEQWPLQ